MFSEEPVAEKESKRRREEAKNTNLNPRVGLRLALRSRREYATLSAVE